MIKRQISKPVTFIIFLLAFALSISSLAMAKGGPPINKGSKPGSSASSGGHDGDDKAGNNLSLPVIWSDNYALSLREPVGTEANLNGDAYCTLNGTRITKNNVADHINGCGATHLFYQQDADNIWQAGTLLPDEIIDVDYVDWGDNLEAKAWYESQVVRVEIVLYQDLDVAMRTYEMQHIEGEGQDEMWGTTGNHSTSNEATIYSHCARLVIQKIAAVGQELTWDGEQWNGASDPCLNSAVWDAGDGPEYFSAEVNVSGKLIYGYNWKVRELPNAAGVYRITFVLDERDIDGKPDLNSSLEYATVKISEEEESASMESDDGGGPGGGGNAVILADENLSYMDVTILPRDKGSGKGGKKGKGKASKGRK